MDKELKKIFEAMLKRYGSHVAAAKALGIDKDYYRAMRNGRTNISKNMAFIIKVRSATLLAESAA